MAILIALGSWLFAHLWRYSLGLMIVAGFCVLMGFGLVLLLFAGSWLAKTVGATALTFGLALTTHGTLLDHVIGLDQFHVALFGQSDQHHLVLSKSQVRVLRAAHTQRILAEDALAVGLEELATANRKTRRREAKVDSRLTHILGRLASDEP